MRTYPIKQKQWLHKFEMCSYRRLKMHRIGEKRNDSFLKKLIAVKNKSSGIKKQSSLAGKKITVYRCPANPLYFGFEYLVNVRFLAMANRTSWQIIFTEGDKKFNLPCLKI